MANLTNSQRLALRIVTALLAFVIGVALTKMILLLNTVAGRQAVVPEPIIKDTYSEVRYKSQPLEQEPQAPLTPEAVGEEVQIATAFIDNDELTYNSYVVQKRYKKVWFNYPSEMKEPPSGVEVSYAVLKRGGKVLAQFDGVYFEAGNSTRFGLFSFLGGEMEQLIVSQDIFRGGRQWIVSLSPRFRIIHDSAEYGVGREAEDMGISDLDKDGIYEITQPVTAFYGFSKWIPTGRTPLPTVIFKYDAKAKKYLPANNLFQDHLLKGIDEARGNISGPEDRINHLSDILPIVLDYIFAGEEQEAWTFYEEAYKLPDKVEIKKEIKAVLKDQPVYRFMYKKINKR